MTTKICGNNNSSTSTSTHRYTVLYYKRKNKVHKSKGVSKLDGTLVVVGVGGTISPASIILKSCDSDDIIYRGAFRGDGGGKEREGKNPIVFEIDEIIPVGGYEVEILSCDDNGNSNHDSGSISSRSSNNIKTSRLKKNSLLSNRINNRKLLVGNSGRNLSVSKITTTSIGVKRSLLGKPLLGGRKPPAQPSSLKKKSLMLMSKKKDDSDDEDNDDGNGNEYTYSASSMAKENNVGPSLLNKRKTAGLPVFKKFVRIKTSSIGRTMGMFTTVTPTATTTNTKLKKKDEPDFFSGAIGNPIVPHSIRKVLRPHQIEGVVFLWNCLTGNSDVSRLSPHVAYTQPIVESNDDNYITTSNKKHNYDDDITISSKKLFKGCILCDEMGLGKTLMTIATISALHRRNRDSRFVIVCPSSLVNNWALEFDKWLGNVGLPKRVVVKTGGETGKRQIKAFNTVKPNNLSEVLIISYDLFRMNATILQKVQKLVLLVVDEGHRLKNTKGSLTMTALKSLPCEARLCITATPVQNNLGDIYTLVNFVCPGVLGDLATFRREYERPITVVSSDRNCNADKKRQAKESSRILDGIVKSVMLRRLQKDVLEKILPPRNVFLLFSQPTTCQRELYKDISRSRSSKCSGGGSPEALTTLIRLRLLCTHPNLLKQTDVDSGGKTFAKHEIDIESSSKLMVLNALIQEIREKEPTDKIVIVSNFTSTLTVVEDAILKPSKLNFLRLDGSVKSADRQQLVDTFNRTNADMNFALTLSSKAGGVGLNVIGANRLFMIDPDWNPATDIQAMARIYRQGQRKPCFIYRLFTSGTLEEVILQRQMQKGALASMTVDKAQKSKGNGPSADEMKDCFNLKETRTCDTREKNGKKWPDYNGEESLISQGCPDLALLAVTAKNRTENFPLAFVHIVKDDDDTEHHCDKGLEVDNSDTEEDNNDEEFEMEDDDGIDSHKEDSEGQVTSDEEYEFE